MSEALEERLSRHSDAFSGLLSLIPAKYYYDDDTKTQWNKKKQTKQESRLAKKAKFDPGSKSTALEVLENKQELADKLAEKESDEELADQELGEQEKSLDNEDEISSANHGYEEEEEEEEEEEIAVIFDDRGNKIGKPSSSESQVLSGNDLKTQVEIAKREKKNKANKMTPMEDSKNKYSQSRNITVESNSQVSSNENSVASIPKKSPKNIQELRARLADRINTLREKRKAPGTNAAGAPLNREAILEARRQKQAKKQLKRKREEVEPDRDLSTTAEDDNNSDLNSKANTSQNLNGSSVLFGQVEFNDGSKATGDLGQLEIDKAKKGSRDILGQLKHIQAKKAKIASLDQDKQKEIQEKASWSKAILQSRGEKVKDDEKLLKKSLKQQKKQKKKSEKEWQDRKSNVEKGIQARQAKREENLALRRVIKGKTKKERQKILDAKKKSKPRAGFEGKSKKKPRSNHKSN